MLKKYVQSLAAVVLLAAPMVSQAGHLFTQNTLNTPILLNGGQGIDLPQLTMEGPCNGCNHHIYVENFDSGDTMRVVVGGTTRVFDFDSLPAGWQYFGGGSEPNLSTVNDAQTDDPGLVAESVSAPFTWRIEALSGSFTLTGFRLRITNGTINGTGTDTVTQSQVTSNVPTPVPVLGFNQILALVVAMLAAAALVFIQRYRKQRA